MENVTNSFLTVGWFLSPINNEKDYTKTVLPAAIGYQVKIIEIMIPDEKQPVIQAYSYPNHPAFILLKNYLQSGLEAQF